MNKTYIFGRKANRVYDMATYYKEPKEAKESLEKVKQYLLENGWEEHKLTVNLTYTYGAIFIKPSYGQIFIYYDDEEEDLYIADLEEIPRQPTVAECLVYSITHYLLER